MESKLPLEKELEPIFLEKFPAFPENVKDVIAQYGPYVLLVLSILGLLGILTAFGIGGAALNAGAAAYNGTFNFYIGIIISVITLVLYLMAFSPLKERKRAGWNLIYYALLISLLGNLIQLNLLGVIIGGVVGFWVLFQIRSKYIL